jgi:hypothetical protein
MATYNTTEAMNMIEKIMETCQKFPECSKKCPFYIKVNLNRNYREMFSCFFQRTGNLSPNSWEKEVDILKKEHHH